MQCGSMSRAPSYHFKFVGAEVGVFYRPSSASDGGFDLADKQLDFTKIGSSLSRVYPTLLAFISLLYDSGRRKSLGNLPCARKANAATMNTHD